MSFASVSCFKGYNSPVPLAFSELKAALSNSEFVLKIK